MDRRTLLTAASVSALATVAPLATPSAEAAGKRVIYTNIGTEQTLARATSLLRNAGVHPTRIKVFATHVRQFRDAMPKAWLATGFEPFAGHRAKYDADEMQLRWEQKHPDFVGYNCRITAFGLGAQIVRLGHLNPIDDSRLFMDLEALHSDPSALLNSHELYRFRTLFGRVRTVASTDPKRHLAALQKVERTCGVSFRTNPRLRMVRVVQHDNFEFDELFTGHVGLLLPASDGLWFLEKLSFAQPYQLTRFASRSQLNAYLMKLYDVDTTGTTAPPLLVENGRLMSGYRVLR